MSPAVPQSLSLLIPCYNDAGGIGGVLERVATVLAAERERHGREFEIIVIDDGSTDAAAGHLEEIIATEETRHGRPAPASSTVAEASAAPATVRLLRHPRNLGYGAALKTGGRAARHELIAIIDADGTYPAERLPELLTLLEADGGAAAMAVGARIGANVAIPAVRRPAKWLLNRLANYLTGTHIPDLNSGLRVARRELWLRYERFFPNGFSLTTTITLAALTNGYTVRYLPIDYHARIGSSKIRPIHDTLEFTKLILRTVLYFDPLKVFVPLAMGLLALSILIGVGTLLLSHLWGIGEFMDVTTVLLFVSAMQTFSIGMLADLICKRLGQ